MSRFEYDVVAAPAAPPSIGLSTMTSAPSRSGVSRAASSPFTATVTSAPASTPIAASSSDTVAPSRTV